MMRKMLSICLALLVLPLALGAFAGCGGGGDSLAGTYVCTEHWNEGMVGRITFEFRSDGTVKMAPLGGEGTYEITNGTVTVVNDLMEDGVTLQIQDNTLRIENPLGDVVYTKQ